MEYRVAKWVTHVVGGSYIAAATLFALIWLVVAVAHGDVEILLSSMTRKWLVWGALYVFSIYLVYSLKEKSIRRRLLSWSFSILFHVCLLSYIAIVLDAGIGAFIIGIPETVIIALSVIGLVSCITSRNARDG